MSATVSSIPANQDRPLLLPSSLPSDQRSGAGRRMLTLLDLLTVDKIDGLDRPADNHSDGDDAGGEGGGGAVNRWRFLKERLGLIKIVGGCCGGVADTWRFNSSPPRIMDDERRNSEAAAVVVEEEARSSSRRSSSGVNLAAALAAEREYRTTTEEEEEMATPSRVSLMRLLEETAENRGEKKAEVKEDEDEDEVVVREGGSENEGVCCVCMGRKKGAALIPCGHTYCRKCSHHLWLQRRSCPLCNHPILEILHIF